MSGSASTDPDTGTSGAYLAIDWGTTNRRSFRIAADGKVLEMIRDDLGIRAFERSGYPAALGELRAKLGCLPVIATGMIGSAGGWVETPYLPLPVGLADLARALTDVEGADTMLVPGVALDNGGRCDVMRGEEVQILGAVAAGTLPPDALVCQPGTHNKWVWVEDSRIVNFTTAMTGEIFALLRDHSLLYGILSGAVENNTAFRAGVERSAASRSLLSTLFSTRADMLLGKRAREDAAAFASGVLIGADVAAQDVASAGLVHILADHQLGALYVAAIDLLGGRSTLIDSQAGFTAGIHRIRTLA